MFKLPFAAAIPSLANRAARASAGDSAAIPLVPPPSVAPPVTGIPQGAGRYNPKVRPSISRNAKVGQGEGCMSFFVLCLLCFGAFTIGLCMRHYQQTERFLLNDLADKMFSKVSRIKIEMPEEKK